MPAVGGSIVADRIGVVGIGVVTALPILPWLLTSARATSDHHDSLPSEWPREPDERDAPI